MCAPLSNNLYEEFKRLMDLEFRQCSLVVQKYIKEAKENQEWMLKDIVDDQKIKSFGKSLNFLMEYELINDAETKLKDFNNFIMTSKFMISEAKRYGELSSSEKVVQDMLIKIFHLNTLSDYEGLVQSLIELSEQGQLIQNQRTEEETTEQNATAQLTLSKISRSIEDIITLIGKNPLNFTKFAYELRKQDVNDTYTYDFLNGQVHSQVLVKIVCANKWDSTLKRMVIGKENDGLFTIRSNRSRGVLFYNKEEPNTQVNPVKIKEMTDNAEGFFVNIYLTKSGF